jgi:hypothetical protein
VTVLEELPFEMARQKLGAVYSVELLCGINPIIGII